MRNGKTAKAKIIFKLLDKTEVEAIAYNEIADFCYREYERKDKIMIYGRMEKNYICINEIENMTL